MGIVSKWISLKHQFAETGKPILDTAFESVYKSLSSLYESTLDIAHWSLPTSYQLYKGHDHDAACGASFTRGLSYSEDSGQQPLFEYTFATVDTRRNITRTTTTYRLGSLGQYFPSPRLNGSALSGRLYYEAIDGDFKMEVGTLRNISNASAQGYRLDPAYYKARSLLFETEMPQTSDTSTEETSGRWIDFDVPFFSGEWNHGPFLLFSNVKENTTLKIYSVVVVEEPGVAKVYGLKTLDNSKGGN